MKRREQLIPDELFAAVLEHAKIQNKVGELRNHLGKPKKVLFTVRRQYFTQIVSGVKTEEIRNNIKRWGWLLGKAPPQVAVFMCGRSVHRRWIKRIYREMPEVVLGRPPSPQGVEDLDLPSDKAEDSCPCIIVELGEVYHEPE